MKTNFWVAIAVIIMLVYAGVSTINERKREKEEKKQELAERRKKEEEKRRREENWSAFIEEVKAEIHEAAIEHVYIHGDQKTFSMKTVSFIHPQYSDRDKVRVVDELAERGDPEAQWLWALKRAAGFVDEPENEDIAAKRILSAANSGVVPALIYCVDSYKRQNAVKDAVEGLIRLAQADKETADMIMLEWKREGFYYDMDASAYSALVEHAKKGNARAKWYLETRNINY